MIMWSVKSFFCSSGLLLCSLQIIAVLLHQTCAATNKQNCAPSSCGKITKISHPFRLKDDPASCGDPRYELVCENNITMLSLFSGKYYVQAINYGNFTIRLVDAAIRDGDCSSLPRSFLYASNFTNSYIHSFNADPYQMRAFDTSKAGTLPMFQHVIYMNCSNPVKDDPLYVDTAPCVNWHSQGHFYAIAGDLRVKNIKVDCHVKLVAPVSFFDFDISYWKWGIPNQTFSYAEIHRMLVHGFEVSWMSGPCEDKCGETDCYLSGITERLECGYWFGQCTNPFEFHDKCGILLKWRRFVLDILFGIVTVGLTVYEETILGYEIGIFTGKYVLSSCILVRCLALIFLIAKLIHTCRTRHASIYENIEDFLQGNSLMPIRYSYKDIKKMTKGFKDKLGKGGYGSVYKGKLRSGSLVAVKMLGKPKGNGQDFISEVATIGRIHHANVVQLVGFCFQGSKRALIYDFMSNGSLDRYISSKKDSFSLTHQQMYEISLGVAHGIAYLHQGCDMQILHFDIKPHNILLDDNFIPKVSDFGLAKLYAIDNSIVTLTAARGTIGYMAPELFYKNIGGVSHKADVYSFGMLLMEMANKRRNLNPHADHSSQIFIPFWIYNQLVEDREIEMGEVTNEEKKNIKKMLIVALWCIQLRPNDRPSMNKVIEMLEGDIDNIEMPPKPSLYPIEANIGDLEIKSDESVSDDPTGSTCFLDETIEYPLLMCSS